MVPSSGHESPYYTSSAFIRKRAGGLSDDQCRVSRRSVGAGSAKERENVSESHR